MSSLESLTMYRNNKDSSLFLYNWGGGGEEARAPTFKLYGGAEPPNVL